MELSQTDGNDKKQSESLLDHGNEIEIVGNGTRTVKRFPPLCQQVSVLFVKISIVDLAMTKMNKYIFLNSSSSYWVAPHHYCVRWQ